MSSPSCKTGTDGFQRAQRRSNSSQRQGNYGAYNTGAGRGERETERPLMEDPRGTAGLRLSLSLSLSLWGNRRPFNQTSEIEKQTRTLIIQRRVAEGMGGEGRGTANGSLPKKPVRSRGILRELPLMFKVKTLPKPTAAARAPLRRRRIFEECGNLSRIPIMPKRCLPPSSEIRSSLPPSLPPFHP